jgi:putative membrane protein
MNHKTLKLVSALLCACLLLGGAGGIVFAASGGSGNAAPEAAAVAEDRSGTGIPTKDETVYVLAGADGSVKKVIVSDWLSNAMGAAELADPSELSGIESVSGDDAAYDVSTGSWHTQGGDVYYQGTIDKELPVTLSVSYQLDGQPVSAEELAGKSGCVTIRFDFENRQYEMVEVNGRREKIYVPFVALTGLILDNDSFTNVEAVNGRIINDGDRTIVAGIAFPGMRESLGLDSDRLEIPDFFEVTADVSDFSLGMTLTIIANELFDGVDTDNGGSLDDLTDSLGALTDAMEQLIDGSSQLYDGLCTLLEKSGALSNGVNQLTDGALQVKNGAAALDSGAFELQVGAAQLYAGLQTLDANSAALNGGARQVFETLVAAAQAQLTAAGVEVPDMTPENYADVLSGVIASLDESAVYAQALAAVTSAVETQRGYIETQVTAAVQAEVEASVIAAVRAEIAARVTEAVREQIRPQVETAAHQSVSEQVVYAATGMDLASYEAAAANGLVEEATQAAISAAIEEKMASDEIRQLIDAKLEEQLSSEPVQSAISGNTEAQMASDEVNALISATILEKMDSAEVAALIGQTVDTQVEKAISENMAGAEVQSQLAAASEGAQQIISLKTSLDVYNAFYLGLRSYTSGVSQAAAGAGELQSGIDSLKSGSGQLSAGADALYSGSVTLQSSVPALVDGITQLRDGASELSDGIKKLNEEGIQKLVEAVSGDLAGALDRLNAMIDVSRNYRNFSGISDEMDGRVKFIYRTEEIGE